MRRALREKETEKERKGKKGRERQNDNKRRRKRGAERGSCAQAQQRATLRCAAAVAPATVKDVRARFAAPRERKCWSETQRDGGRTGRGRPRENVTERQMRKGEGYERGRKEGDGRRREREELGRTFHARVPLYRAPARSTRRIRASRSPASSGLEYVVAGDSCAQGGERDRQDQSLGRFPPLRALRLAVFAAFNYSILYIG